MPHFPARRLSENPAERDCDRLQIPISAPPRPKRPQRRHYSASGRFGISGLISEFSLDLATKRILGQPPNAFPQLKYNECSIISMDARMNTYTREDPKKIIFDIKNMMI